MAKPPITLIPNDNPRTANSAIDKVTDHYLEYRNLILRPNKDIWSHSLSDDLICLAQGVGTRMTAGTNTVFFIRRCNIPDGRKFTYSRFMASI